MVLDLVGKYIKCDGGITSTALPRLRLSQATRGRISCSINAPASRCTTFRS